MKPLLATIAARLQTTGRTCAGSCLLTLTALSTTVASTQNDGTTATHEEVTLQHE